MHNTNDVSGCRRLAAYLSDQRKALQRAIDDQVRHVEGVERDPHAGEQREADEDSPGCPQEAEPSGLGRRDSSNVDVCGVRRYAHAASAPSASTRSTRARSSAKSTSTA